MSFLMSDIQFLACGLTWFWITMFYSYHMQIIFVALQIYFSKASLEIEMIHFQISF